MELFKRLDCITTTPLAYYGQAKPHFVRIAYSLVKDKTKKKLSFPVYKLLRKETTNILDAKFSGQGIGKRQKNIEVSRYLIANNIKQFSIEYVPVKDPEQKEEKASQKKAHHYAWGQTKKTKNKLPAHVLVRLELFDDGYETTRSFECMIPCYAQGTDIQLSKQAASQAPGKQKPSQGVSKTPEGQRTASKEQGMPNMQEMFKGVAS